MANNFDEITYTTDKVLRGSLSFHLHSNLREAVIRYTSDGSLPDKSSRVCRGPVQTGGRNGVVRAQLFRNGMPWGRVFELPYNINKATGARISVSGKEENAAAKLVNGLSGTHRYNDNQWIRCTKDVEAVLDLGSSETITAVGANVLNYIWQRMWPPVSMDFHVSDNGTDYTKIASFESFPVNGINKARKTIDPVKARYVKITAQHPGIIPAGKYGAGSTAIMMIDEFILE